MAYISTEDPCVREYCRAHPEAGRLLKGLLEAKADFLCRYGRPLNGGTLDLDNKNGEFAGVKAVQLDLLRELKHVCDENGLKLFLIYGSLLGAVRSGGMIEGDDDIDVALMREDYDKLVQLASRFKPPYFLQNNYNDDCFFGGYIKLRNSGTTAIDPQNWYVDCCEGISIDIFPMDATFSSAQAERRKLQKIHRLQRLLYAKSYGFFASFKDMPLPVWKAYKYLGKLFPRERLLRMFDAACRAGDSTPARLAVYTHYGSGLSARYVPAAAYRETLTMDYEGMVFPAPSGWDGVLFSIYGYGYLMPSLKGEGLHAFYRADVPYKEYKRRFTALFRSAPGGGKRLLVLGDVELYGEYKRRFPGAAYKPDAFIELGGKGRNGRTDESRLLGTDSLPDRGGLYDGGRMPGTGGNSLPATDGIPVAGGTSGDGAPGNGTGSLPDAGEVPVAGGLSDGDNLPAGNCLSGAASALKGYDPASTHVVIAAFDFPAAESLLRKLGFHDYSIYIYDRGWLKLPDPAASRVKYMLGRDGEDV